MSVQEVVDNSPVSSGHRSLKTRFSQETVHSASTTTEILFPKGRGRSAAEIFVNWLRDRNTQATKNAVSEFADKLEMGELTHNNKPFRYSRRNFYMTVLKTLVDLGFIQRNQPVWDERSKRTLFVYKANIFDIPQKPPAVGFWRTAYYVCKKWNNIFTS